jgi:hypothetical protein
MGDALAALIATDFNRETNNPPGCGVPSLARHLVTDLRSVLAGRPRLAVVAARAAAWSAQLTLARECRW